MAKSLYEQVALSTGKQTAVCPGCGNSINVRVGGEKKSLQRGPYREYFASCRHCKVTYSGAKYKIQY